MVTVCFIWGCDKEILSRFGPMGPIFAIIDADMGEKTEININELLRPSQLQLKVDTQPATGSTIGLLDLALQMSARLDRWFGDFEAQTGIEIEALDRRVVEASIDTRKIQIENVVYVAIQSSPTIDIETVGPYAYHHRGFEDELKEVKYDNMPADEVAGIEVAALLKSVISNSRVVSLLDEKHDLRGNREFKKHEKELFAKSIYDIYKQKGVIRHDDHPGLDFLLISESERVGEVDALIERLKEVGRERNQNLVEEKDDGTVIFYHKEAGSESVYRGGDWITLKDKGRPVCAALDASAFLNQENQELMHLVILEKYYESQQDAVFAILNTLGIRPDNYHNIFFDRTASPTTIKLAVAFCLRRGLDLAISSLRDGLEKAQITSSPKADQYSIPWLIGYLRIHISLVFNIESSLVKIEHPTPENISSDLAIECHLIADAIGRSVDETAVLLQNSLDIDWLDDVAIDADYVNFRVKTGHIALWAGRDRQMSEDFGFGVALKDRTVLVDFASPNLAKPLSVGHLRPINQGWGLISLLRSQGATVIGDNHIGDWGTPFGKWVVGFLEYSSDEKLEQDGVYELARIYIKVNEVLESESASGRNGLKNRVDQWLQRLESGDSEAIGYKERFQKYSLDHLEQMFDRMGVKPDENIGESFYVDRARMMIDDLVTKQVAEEQPDGSVIVRLDEFGITTPALIKKSDKTLLYLSTDLATIDFRQEKWNPDRIIYVVAVEQRFHFQQLFALSQKLGYKIDLQHYWFGLVQQLDAEGKRSKMSSRAGTVLLEDLLDDVVDRLKANIPDSRRISAQDIDKLAIASIKFADFANHPHKDIVFNIDGALDLAGFSATYIIYTIKRIETLLTDYRPPSEIRPDQIRDSYRAMVWRSLQLPVLAEESVEKLEMHYLCRFAYDLARIVNHCYEHELMRDMDEVNASHAAYAYDYANRSLKSALKMLGIEIPKKI